MPPAARWATSAGKLPQRHADSGLGDGLRLRQAAVSVYKPLALKLVFAVPFSNGVVALEYRRTEPKS
ncbi:MAG: hypothetical protein EOR86_24400 [Mesorhizobium sp.]|uniref:hypothetical protein n=1 Tax=Mesorhizobium sp. TaxID=1871066 RepID=UPI000FE6A62B|nr:hypothetical protein [Mesorhizobium sp.]RWM91705.1 MAG: hypothetical protein EOR86_24400 [Mesorhizobium sp.]